MMVSTATPIQPRRRKNTSFATKNLNQNVRWTLWDSLCGLFCRPVWRYPNVDL
jgi:hypothetical protein